MVIDAYRNAVVASARYDLDIDEAVAVVAVEPPEDRETDIARMRRDGTPPVFRL